MYAIQHVCVFVLKYVTYVYNIDLTVFAFSYTRARPPVHPQSEREGGGVQKAWEQEEQVLRVASI